VVSNNNIDFTICIVLRLRLRCRRITIFNSFCFNLIFKRGSYDIRAPVNLNFIMVPENKAYISSAEENV